MKKKQIKKSLSLNASMPPRAHASAYLELVFLGTNGWYDTVTGNTVSILVKARDFDIVLDAGSGLAKLDKYCDFKKPVYIFLSHVHLDHVSGLHGLARFHFEKGLNLVAPRFYKKALSTLLSSPYTLMLSKLSYKVVFHWLPGKVYFPFNVRCLPLRHADPVLGYDFIIDGKKLVYITDTGYCRNAVRLARGADLLITECAYRRGEKNEKWPHFNPETASELSKKARVKKLILTHFAGDRYPSFRTRMEAIRQARYVFRNSFAARDGLTIKV